MQYPEVFWQNRPAPMSHPEAVCAMTIDYGHTIPEIFSREKSLYFKSIPEINCFFMEQTLVGPIGFFWREEDGGKGANETCTCQWLSLTEFANGAGHLEVFTDTAGHVYGQLEMKLLEYLSSPRNPNRMCLSASITGCVKGHSGHGSDFANLLIDNCLKNCRGDLVTIEDVLNWAKAHSGITVRSLDRFLNFQQMFENAGIYKDLTRVKDDIGYYRVRNIKPWRINFNYSCVQDEWVITNHHP